MKNVKTFTSRKPEAWIIYEKQQRIHRACDKERIKLFVKNMSECSFLFLMPSFKGLSELYKQENSKRFRWEQILKLIKAITNCEYSEFINTTMLNKNLRRFKFIHSNVWYHKPLNVNTTLLKLNMKSTSWNLKSLWIDRMK